MPTEENSRIGFKMLPTALVRDAKYMFENNLASKVKSNSNIFWKYVRSCTKVQSNVSILECDDGLFTETDYEATNVFTEWSLSDIPTPLNK